ncbi:MAG: Rab family GTPase [Pseudomonadales bacterium]
MIQKKVCMLGDFAVGKTSLVRCFVDNVFSQSQRTTLGVKIDNKVVSINDTNISLTLWDIHEEDSYERVSPAYFRGIAGYLLLVDPTRPSTLAHAASMQKDVERVAGGVPFVLVKNKVDSKSAWRIAANDLAELEGAAVAVAEVSAMTGEGVSQAFESLALEFLPSSKRLAH